MFEKFAEKAGNGADNLVAAYTGKGRGGAVNKTDLSCESDQKCITRSNQI